MPAILRSFHKVFQRRGYLALFVGFSMFIVLFTTVIIQWSNFANIATTNMLPLSAKVRLLFLFFLHPGARADLGMLIMIYGLALLFSISLTLNIYAVRELRMGKSWLGQAGGVVLGSLGFGCAACGTFVLSGVLSTFGMAALVSFLPLHGREFLIAGIFLLAVSIFRTAKSIDMKTCEIQEKT